jgi:SAM-dependent methyltransferase
MDNRQFWNDRYMRCPELGSGPGSRALASYIKSQILKLSLSRTAISSLIDVGCGDLCYVDGDLLKGLCYVGIDISDTVIARNKQRFPFAKFYQADIVNDLLPLAAELVLSFDVLIHQTPRENFDRALINTLSMASEHALISYLTPPGPPPQYELEFPPSPPHVLEKESSFQSFLGILDEDVPRAEVYRYGDLIDIVRQLDPQWIVRPLASYRLQSIYELARNSWMF